MFTKTAFPESVQGIIHKLTTLKQLKPSTLIQVIREANVKPKDLEPWVDFKHPALDSYGRKLIYQGTNFELLVMSWLPGDFSTIHDHGNTMWGAVQIFGAAEHATFHFDDGHLTTQARWQVKPGDVLGVGHSLIHQMGNPTNQPFMSLHIYGTDENLNAITGDSRIFDLENGTIQRHNGGVFFGLEANQVDAIEPGLTSDFHTRLRHMVELSRRLMKINAAGIDNAPSLQSTLTKTFSSHQRLQLLSDLEQHIDEHGHEHHSMYWKNLNMELQEAAKLQAELEQNGNENDHFHAYAKMYDALICQPMLDRFMAKYLSFFKEAFVPDLAEKSIISLGVGTGLIEQHMMDYLGVPYENIYGIDVSKAMVTEARKRLTAEHGDVLALNPNIKLWDIAFSGLNVFHYIDYEQLEEAVKKTARIVKSGGYFIGDFITPDHIRWYPNVMYSDDKKIISLRTPRLVEENGRIFQESEIVNVDFTGDKMVVNYAGKHKRFLPPIHRIRQFFTSSFGDDVQLFDAYSLEPIADWADTCKSTRYIVVAKKA